LTKDEGQNDKLPLEQEGEEEMATVPCVQCGLEHNISSDFSFQGRNPAHSEDIIKGVLYCGSCGAPTVFTIKDNATIFLPGKLLTTNLNERVAENAKTMIQEASECFYGGSFMGVVAMCRSAVVEAILSKRIGNRSDSVPGLVEKAKKAGLVDAQDEVRGISAGLIAREALHHMGAVSEYDALFAIRAAVEFVNNVSERTPTSASQ